LRETYSGLPELQEILRHKHQFLAQVFWTSLGCQPLDMPQIEFAAHSEIVIFLLLSASRAVCKENGLVPSS
jgi:hypothetical protein